MWEYIDLVLDLLFPHKRSFQIPELTSCKQTTKVYGITNV